MTAPRCGRVLYGGKRGCIEPLEVVTDRMGRVRYECRKCKRYAAGLCRDCPAPRTGRSHRCAACRARVLGADQKRRDMTPRAYRRRQKSSLAWWHRVGKFRRTKAA